MNIKLFVFLLKALAFILSFIFNAFVGFIGLVLSAGLDDGEDAFAVDYPHYTPSVDKPGNIAMHDLLHS